MQGRIGREAASWRRSRPILPCAAALQRHAPGSAMQKRATDGGPYSLVFLSITVIVGILALVRQDGTVTLALGVLGLYVLHLLSLRSQVRSARAANRPAGAAAETVPPGNSPFGAESGPVPYDGADVVAAPTGSVSGLEQATADRQMPAGDDRAWMVQISESEAEPEFLTPEGDEDQPDFTVQKGVSSDVPIPRKFALGTVAIIRRALDPEQVARVLEEQRKFPKKRFGEIAVELDYMTESQLEELLAAQQAGLFTDDEIQEARMSLEAYRRRAASPAT